MNTVFPTRPLSLRRLIIFVFGVLAFCSCSSDNKPISNIDSKNLKNTIFTPRLNQEIKTGQNVVYCSSFQLAWNELKDKIVHEAVRLENEPPLGSFLNDGLSNKDDVSADGYLAMAGFAGENIVPRINNLLREKFKEEAPSFEEKTERSEDIVIYAFL